MKAATAAKRIAKLGTVTTTKHLGGEVYSVRYLGQEIRVSTYGADVSFCEVVAPGEGGRDAEGCHNLGTLAEVVRIAEMPNRRAAFAGGVAA